MNLEILHQHIANPNLIKEDEIQALRDLTIKYPFAQLFSILYLKALATNQHINFDEELQEHAYRITDRSKLYELIQDKQEEIIKEVVLKEDPQPEIIPIQEKLEVEPILTLTEDLVLVEEIESETIVELTPEEIQSENADFSEVLIEQKQDEKPEERIDVATDALEKEMLAHAMSSAYSLALEEENKEEKPSTTPVDIDQARSFTSWLKQSAPEKDQAQANIAKTAEMLKQLKNNEKSKDTEVNPKEVEKKEFFSASKTARQSVLDDKLIYSETLANIFAAQGNYPKAILAFQQLMLTIPEKKLYFAQKIKDLKLKLNT